MFDQSKQPLGKQPLSRAPLSSRSGGSWWPVVWVALPLAAGLAFGYGTEQHAKLAQLTSHDSQLNAEMNRVQNQMDILSEKMSELAAARTAAVTAAKAAPSGASLAHARAEANHRSAAEEKRFNDLQSRVDQQQDHLNQTDGAVAKTRTDLEGNLNSTRDELNGSINRTRDELNGSIARTHEELVALERRGERNYFEFDLTRSKSLRRVGPLMISLRKADTKHKSYDLLMVVDDNELSKKHVNLFEPILVSDGDDVQPVQVVVNRIEKDHVRGYVSAPKYQQARIAANTAEGNANALPATAKNPATPQ